MRDLIIEVNNNNKDGIDESLYSRQLYVLGHDAMRRMQNADVLISGLGGLGVEIAKSIILGGVKSVALHDTKICTVKDLASQYYLNKCCLGRNRAESCAEKLAELNNYVTTSVITDELCENVINKFRVVVLTETSLKEQKRIAEICRQHKVALIIADTKGLFGQIFCDFGENFIVYDDDGIAPKTGHIIGISKENEGVITTEKWHNLFDGDYVTFSGVSIVLKAFYGAMMIYVDDVCTFGFVYGIGEYVELFDEFIKCFEGILSVFRSFTVHPGILKYVQVFSTNTKHYQFNRGENSLPVH